MKCEDESLIGCMVEPPFYIADNVEELKIALQMLNWSLLKR